MRFADTYFDRQFAADEADPDKICNGLSPNPGFGCTLLLGHELTHLGDIGNGYAIAEWDDNRDTDGEVW